MNNKKTVRKGTFFFIRIIGLSVLILGSMFAQNIPQAIGLKDVEYSSLNKTLCRGCHGESLVEDHHKTASAVSGDCASCHKVSTQAGNVGVEMQRDCMICHEKTPHHATAAAQNNECNTCHESPGLSAFSTQELPYKVSRITPTTTSCNTCHKEGVVDGVNVVSVKTTHHGIALKGCNVCHDENDKKSTNIRTCERCHSVKALHEILPHVQKENCVHCHGGTKPAVQPEGEKKTTN